MATTLLPDTESTDGEYDNDEQQFRENQAAELIDWLFNSVHLRKDQCKNITKLLFQENLYTLEDILAVLPNNPNALPRKVGPANIKKIIQALIDENLLPTTSRAARSIQPVEE
jgi:hypothetical protein